MHQTEYVNFNLTWLRNRLAFTQHHTEKKRKKITSKTKVLTLHLHNTESWKLIMYSNDWQTNKTVEVLCFTVIEKSTIMSSNVSIRACVFKNHYEMNWIGLKKKKNVFMHFCSVHSNTFYLTEVFSPYYFFIQHTFGTKNTCF